MAISGDQNFSLQRNSPEEAGYIRDIGYGHASRPDDRRGKGREPGDASDAVPYPVVCEGDAGERFPAPRAATDFLPGRAFQYPADL